LLSVIVFILFWLNLVCTIVVAFAYGLVLERSMAAGLVAISVMLVFMSLIVTTDHVAYLSIISDCLILLVTWYFALTSDRYWPIWFAAMQTLTVLTLVVTPTQIGLPHFILLNLAGFWSLPALIVMTWGTILDWRERASASPSPS
jgi:hypothetical protein